MALRPCPRCDDTPERSSAPACSAIPDPDDTTYFLMCQCDDEVKGDSPGACEAAWNIRCDNLNDSMAEAAHEAFCSDFYGGGGPVTMAEQMEAGRRQKLGLEP
jgi:hypothetical protein